MFHAERAEHVLAQVAVERGSGDVLDDLAERGEPVIGVRPLGAWLGVDAQAVAVVLGQRGHRPARGHAPAQYRPQQVGGFAYGPDPGGVSQQVPQRGRPEPRPGGDQPEGAQVAAGRRVQVNKSPFLQLHDGDRRDGLGHRGDPEHGVRADRRARAYVGDAVPVEPRQGSAADHPDGQASDRPAVEDLADPGRQRTLIE